MRLQKWLSGLLAGVMLLGLAACGGETVSVSVEESALTAQEAIEKGDYETAYKLLKPDNNPEAQEVLKKLIFVPAVWEWKSDDQEGRVEFTYDDNGNPLSMKETENGNVYETVYKYDANGHLCSSVHTSRGEVTLTVTYTCDEQGRVVREQRTDEYETTTYTYAYDAEGHLVDDDRIPDTYLYVYDSDEYKSFYTHIIKEKSHLSDDDFLAEDEFDNPVEWQRKSYKATCSWELFYYPEGISKLLAGFISRPS